MRSQRPGPSARIPRPQARRAPPAWRRRRAPSSRAAEAMSRTRSAWLATADHRSGPVRGRRCDELAERGVVESGPSAAVCAAVARHSRPVAPRRPSAQATAATSSATRSAPTAIQPHGVSFSEVGVAVTKRQRWSPSRTASWSSGARSSSSRSGLGGRLGGRCGRTGLRCGGARLGDLAPRAPNTPRQGPRASASEPAASWAIRRPTAAAQQQPHDGADAAITHRRVWRTRPSLHTGDSTPIPAAGASSGRGDVSARPAG